MRVSLISAFGHPKLVKPLINVYTCTEMLLIFVPGDTFIDFRGLPADEDGPNITYAEGAWPEMHNLMLMKHF